MVILANNLIAAISGGVFYTPTSCTSLNGSDTLQESPASILAAYIINTLADMTSPSEENDWPLYISAMPSGNNVKSDCGAIYDTTGWKDGRLMAGQVIQHYGIQLKVRSKVYQTGWTKLENIASDLDKINGVLITVDSRDYSIETVVRTGPVGFMGQEEGTRRRFLFTVNLQVTIRDVTV